MPFLDSILKHRSLSIVGMEKNTGKTETLNYILGRLPASVCAAVTSIGTDGERKDIVTGTSKPEIFLRSGTVFGTGERYYALRKLTAEILDIDPARTIAGRVVTARTVTSGTVMLSGPSSTAGLGRWIGQVSKMGTDLIIIDGALSRRSSASPALSEALILATGAAFSADPNRLVRETAYAIELICLPAVDEELGQKLGIVQAGVWGVGKEMDLKPLGTLSTLSGTLPSGDTLRGIDTIYVAGALTDRLIGMLRTVNPMPEIVVEDFTRIFVTLPVFDSWVRRGGRISVLRRSHLLAVTVNPVAPSGARLDSEKVAAKIRERTGVPAYDVRKCNDIR